MFSVWKNIKQVKGVLFSLEKKKLTNLKSLAINMEMPLKIPDMSLFKAVALVSLIISG